MIGLLWLLSGCVQSDLTLRFDHHHHGQWTQTITLGERNLAVASDALSPWLQHLRNSVQRLGGHLRQTPSTIEITVPFSTPADLVQRFDQVFATPGPPRDPAPGENPGDRPPTILAVPGLGAVPFHLETQERHWGLLSQVRLIYDLDLRPLAGTLPTGSNSAQSDGVSVQLQTPWGLRSLGPDALPPDTLDPTAARWRLPLGQVNHIDVYFWLPNWIGLGGLILTGMVLLGYGMRYRWLGPPR